LWGIAQGLVIANIVSRNATGLTAWNFLRSDESTGFTSKSSAARVTLKELIKGGEHYNTGKTELELVWENIQSNWMTLAGGLIATPILFKVSKKLLKPILTPTRKVIKMTGLGNDITI
jgi:hypothetical protein